MKRGENTFPEMQERSQLGWYASWGKTGPPACRERELTGKECKSGTCSTWGKVKAHGTLHDRHWPARCQNQAPASHEPRGTTNHLHFQSSACPSKHQAGVGIVRVSFELDNTWVSICKSCKLHLGKRRAQPALLLIYTAQHGCKTYHMRLMAVSKERFQNQHQNECAEDP